MNEKVISLFSRMREKGTKKTQKAGKKKKIVIVSVLIILCAASAFFINRGKKNSAASAQGQKVNTASVVRQNITSTLSSSGTISPKDTYSITSMAEGEVIEAGFEEGDQVEAGQSLYRIDASSMESKLSSASNSVSRAESNYNTAVSDYNEAVRKYSGNTYKSTKSGYVKQLHIEAGDKVGANTQIADIYNDQIMKIKVPFLNIEAASILPGSTATLTLSDTLEQLEGVVTGVSTMDETMTGGRLVRYVTIEVANPGGLTADMAAAASVGEFVSSGDGTFTASVNTVMAADLPSNVEVEEILVSEGDFVSEGSPVFRMKADSAEKLIKTYKDSMDSAQSGLEQAQSSLDSTRDTYDDYTITAPISGTVIKKNYKVGDKIQNGSNASALAVIYDMSSVTFQMNIDELDISSVKVGQTVQITADAFENQEFTGKVTNISLEGTSSNGVTYYPVTVTLDEVGGLLPGMNVDGTIIVDSAENALAVPADALQRGSKVYVKDDSVTEAKGRVPAGFREVEVETGLISSDYVEIISGDLQEGDVVYVAESSTGSGNEAMMMPMQIDVPGGQGGGSQGGSRGGQGGGNHSGGRP